MADLEDKQNNADIFVPHPDSPLAREGRRLKPIENVVVDGIDARVAEQESQMNEIRRLEAIRAAAAKKAEEARLQKEKEKKMDFFSNYEPGKNNLLDAIRKKLQGE